MKGSNMRPRLARPAAVLLAALLLFSTLPLAVFGDEGMFLPDAISTLAADKLAKRGLKLKPTDIYNPNGISLKDAVVIVGGGTGEFVSPDGLLLTNHHVAFDALVSASSEKNDYGTTGYLANSRAEELPAKDYTVTITQDLKDVTADVLKDTNASMSVVERNTAIQSAIRRLQTASNESQGIQVQVVPMNEGLSYYQFTYQVLPDVRIVYAPPKSIGFFGGDDDNFEWPRHCGDFTFMRAYVAPDGKPAAYSTSNVPYKPKKFLSLSMAGIKEGDFMMVMGYPGTTRRYRESFSVQYNQDVYMPFLIDVFSTRIDLLRDAGKNDETLRVRLQSEIFGLSNTLKDFEGSVIAMRRADIVQTKRDQEAAFTRFINENPARKARYGEVLPSLAKLYEQLNTTAQHDLVIQQLASATSLLQFATFALELSANKDKPEAQRNAALSPATAQRVRASLGQVFAERVPSVDQRFLAYMLRQAAALPANQKIEAVEKRFGNLQGEARRKAEEDFARDVTQSTRFATAAEFGKLFDMSSAELRALHEPLIEFAGDISAELAKGQEATQNFNASVSRLRPILIQGMSEMTNSKPYPDANRTLRFTYGEVKGYVPREAIIYQPFTTLSGVIQKDTGRVPFNVPQKLKDLYRSRDFGPYAISDGSDVPVDLLATTDIIGGNSGSPIFNGRGEQVGIVFDGNYEGLGNDFFYNAAEDRTIAVDIRYVLFIADKFGGAGYLLKELDLKNMTGGKSR
jgi:S1-C subfamily serine protease